MANGIKLGNDTVSFKVGNTDVDAIYLGNTLVYPTAPPSFQGKWLATYQDSHTESAECNSTSAITSGEITLTNLVEVEVGDCVTEISNSAFQGCGSLKSCTIGNSVTSIGNQTFYQCSALTSCTMGNSVTSIGNWAFRNSSSLTSITVNATTPPTLGNNAFTSTSNSLVIYVPSASVNTYKSASGWSSYASRIQAIPRLPDGYTEVEYIENDSMACINTNFVPDQDTRLLMSMKYDDNLAGRYCGCGYWNHIDSMAFNFENGNLHIAWGGITQGWKEYEDVMVEANYTHIYDWNKNTFSIDGNLIDTEQQVTFTAPQPLGIFTFMTSSWSGTMPPTQSNEYLHGKMYSFQIYDNGTLVRNLVPCIDPNNIAGAYDLVNGLFYGSANNNYTFTAGPIV